MELKKVLLNKIFISQKICKTKNLQNKRKSLTQIHARLPDGRQRGPASALHAHERDAVDMASISCFFVV